VTTHAGQSAEPPHGGGSAPLAPALVADLMWQLDKTVRLHQLYPSGNPTYLKTLEALREAFRAVWAHADEIALQVTETRFTWNDAVVLDEEAKASDSLPWTLFKDGVRQVTFAAGFEDEEVLALLEIIPKVRRAQDYEDDVLTLLWEQDFAHLTYRYIDTVTSEGAPMDPSATPGRWPASATEREDARGAVEAARQRAEAAATAALDAAMQAAVVPDADAERARLAAMQHLDSAIAAEYDANLRRDACNALLDIFELQRDAAVRAEIVRHLDAMMLHLLTARDFAGIASLLRESAVAAARAPAITAELGEALAHLADRVSDPALLGPLLELADDAEPRPSREDVAALVGHLGARALGALFWWAAESKHRDLRLLYAAAADRLGEDSHEELVRLMQAEQTPVALEAMQRCALLNLDAALAGLMRQLGHAEEPRRMAALSALAIMGTPRAMSALERALGDESAPVRIAALKILTHAAYRPVLPRISEIVQGRDIRDTDPGELRALFDLFGTLCGDAGVPWLQSQLVASAGFFKRKSDPETRACAASALGRVNTPLAREVLQAATGIDDPLIRRAVKHALDRREEGR